MEYTRLLQEMEHIPDVCGPIALIRDIIAEGSLENPSFQHIYGQMAEHAPSYIGEMHCHSLEHKDLHLRFLESYQRDLGLDMDSSWKLQYKELLRFMKNTMKKQDLVPNRYGVIFPFRQRSLHMERSACWALRLAREYPDIDLQRLMSAVILHDIGYSLDTDGITHAYTAVPVIRAYLLSQGMNAGIVDSICDMVYKHSDKTYLDQPDNDLYFQLLLEADHLDETGAMSIVWDVLASMNAPEPSLSDTAAHIARYTLKMLHEFPMRTPAGIRFWREKQHLVTDFYQLLIMDLEEFI